MSLTEHKLYQKVHDIVHKTKFTDIHTHLYAPHFGELMLFGMDELLTYHYLVAEVLRVSDISSQTFWALTKQEQAAFIWDHLFVRNTPISEACRGIVTILKEWGIDSASKDLKLFRKALISSNRSEYVDEVFEKANVGCVVMTNDPFNPVERQVWLNENNKDPRFYAALRIDALLNNYLEVVPQLRKWSFLVEENLNSHSIEELKRFVSEWINRMNALYVACSLPNTFDLSDKRQDLRNRMLLNVVLPVCREKGRPFAMMIGVKRGVNPEIKSAGDGLGKSMIEAVETLCLNHPKNKFMVTMLSRENQHELTVASRKFRNLLVFGCWWFLNNPSMIEEITMMRTELLGHTYIPQHSDARILEQLVYKWRHSREIITKVLARKYLDLLSAGWPVTEADIQCDVNKLFNDNFWDFIKK